MKARVHIVTLAVAATAAIGTQAAQGRQLWYAGKQAADKSAQTKSVLAAMTEAGINFHASAELGNERHVVGRATSGNFSPTHVRPDDRSGPREP
jgi:glycine cleavage system aminomethyltransferase T